MREDTEVASALRHATASSLVLLDEFGKGTHAADGAPSLHSLPSPLLSSPAAGAVAVLPARPSAQRSGAPGSLDPAGGPAWEDPGATTPHAGDAARLARSVRRLLRCVRVWRTCCVQD